MWEEGVSVAYFSGTLCGLFGPATVFPWWITSDGGV